MINTRRSFKYLLCLALLTNNYLFAAQTESNGVVTLSGYINIAEYDNFLKYLNTKKITQVVFKNCLGGNALAGFRYAEKIKEIRIGTVASGTVASACAFAFLGGVSRTLDETAAENILMFHGSFDKLTNASLGQQINQEHLDIYEKFINFKFSPTVKKIILETQYRDEGIYFISVSSKNGKLRKTLYCDGKIAIDFSKCQSLDGISLEAEGVTTK